MNGEEVLQLLKNELYRIPSSQTFVFELYSAPTSLHVHVFKPENQLYPHLVAILISKSYLPIILYCMMHRPSAHVNVHSSIDFFVHDFSVAL